MENGALWFRESPAAPIATQVAQSCASSRDHLGVEQIDSFVLHGPSQRFGWGEDDRQAWQAMEALQETGQVRLLGVSNVTLPQLEVLCHQARRSEASSLGTGDRR